MSDHITQTDFQVLLERIHFLEQFVHNLKDDINDLREIVNELRRNSTNGNSNAELGEHHTGEKRGRDDDREDVEKKRKITLSSGNENCKFLNIFSIELLERIICELDLQSTTRLAQTCQYLYDLINNSTVIWRRFNENYFSKTFRIPLPRNSIFLPHNLMNLMNLPSIRDELEINSRVNDENNNDNNNNNSNNNIIDDNEDISTREHQQSNRRVVSRRSTSETSAERRTQNVNDREPLSEEANANRSLQHLEEKLYFMERYRAAVNWETGNLFCGAIECTSKNQFLQIHNLSPYTMTSGNVNELTEWDINTGQILSCFQVPSKCHHFYVKDNRIAVSGSDTVRVYDRESKTFLYEVPNLYSVAHRLQIVDRFLVLGFWDGSISIHDLLDGNRLNSNPGHNKPVHALDVDLVHNLVASGSSDKSLKVWNFVTGEVIHHFRGHNMTINSIQFTSNHEQILSASKDNTIKVWDLETSTCVDNLQHHSESVNSLRAENGWIVSGSSDKTLRVWDLRTSSKSVHVLTGHENPVNCLDFDEGKIVSCDDKRILLWRFDYRFPIRKGVERTIM